MINIFNPCFFSGIQSEALEVREKPFLWWQSHFFFVFFFFLFLNLHHVLSILANRLGLFRLVWFSLGDFLLL